VKVRGILRGPLTGVAGATTTTHHTRRAAVNMVGGRAVCWHSNMVQATTLANMGLHDDERRCAGITTTTTPTNAAACLQSQTVASTGPSAGRHQNALGDHGAF